MPKITRQKLPDTIVARLTCPSGTEEAYFWDDDVKGLGLRIYKNGRRSWLYVYRSADGRRLRVAATGRAHMMHEQTVSV